MAQVFGPEGTMEPNDSECLLLMDPKHIFITRRVTTDVDTGEIIEDKQNVATEKNKGNLYLVMEGGPKNISTAFHYSEYGREQSKEGGPVAATLSSDGTDLVVATPSGVDNLEPAAATPRGVGSPEPAPSATTLAKVEPSSVEILPWEDADDWMDAFSRL